MNKTNWSVLVIDDQPDVVHGVMDGVHWEQLGVGQVFPAYSVSEAKTVFRDHGVDLMLCDIEMPPTNGFDLLRWVRENHFPTECIFLSAHAEFEYAKEAVRLGGFDYILQPAPYEEIEAAVSKAIQKIQQDIQMRETYEVGLYWREKEEIMAESCFRVYLSGGQTTDSLVQDLKRLEIPLLPHDFLCPLLIQILPETHEDLSGSGLREILRQMLTQGLKREDDTVLLIQLTGDTFLAILYRGSSQWIDLPAMLRHKISSLREEKGLVLACYMGDEIQLEQLYHEYQLLTRRMQDNVAGYSEVFTPSQRRQIENYVYSFPNMTHWAASLEQGHCADVLAEALHYLQHQKEQGAVTAEFLAKFHQDFIQMFFTVARSYESRTHDIFYEEYPFEDFLRAYTSYDKMTALVEFAIQYIQNKMGASAERTPIERAIDYIRQNIEKDLSRSEIADAIFLNPEYLSRLFKKETGVSLGDFILSEKMGIARSLLADTMIPVSLVASRVGYSNFSYFSQVFKKATGLSPVEYRQKYTKAK